MFIIGYFTQHLRCRNIHGKYSNKIHVKKRVDTHSSIKLNVLIKSSTFKNTRDDSEPMVENAPMPFPDDLERHFFMLLIPPQRQKFGKFQRD